MPVRRECMKATFRLVHCVREVETIFETKNTYTPISCNDTPEHSWSFTKLVQMYISMIMKHCHFFGTHHFITIAATALSIGTYQYRNIKCYSTMSYPPFANSGSIIISWWC